MADEKSMAKQGDSIENTPDYAEKKKLVSRINSRMRKTVKKLGTENREYSKFAGRLSASKTLKTSTSFTNEYVMNKKGDYRNYLFSKDMQEREVEYNLISTSKEDIASYSMEELLRLESQTKTWSKVRASFMQSVDNTGDYDLKSEEGIKEMRRKMNMRHYITQAMEANADLWYDLLDETGWTQDEAQHKSTEEIFNALVKQRAIQTPSGHLFNFKLGDLSDLDVHDKYVSFKNARKIQEEMDKSFDGDVTKVHYEKW